jgi:hypothetical protein
MDRSNRPRSPDDFRDAEHLTDLSKRTMSERVEVD